MDGNPTSSPHGPLSTQPIFDAFAWVHLVCVGPVSELTYRIVSKSLVHCCRWPIERSTYLLLRLPLLSILQPPTLTPLRRPVLFILFFLTYFPAFLSPFYTHNTCINSQLPTSCSHASLLPTVCRAQHPKRSEPRVTKVYQRALTLHPQSSHSRKKPIHDSEDRKSCYCTSITQLGSSPLKPTAAQSKDRASTECPSDKPLFTLSLFLSRTTTRANSIQHPG